MAYSVRSPLGAPPSPDDQGDLFRPRRRRLDEDDVRIAALAQPILAQLISEENLVTPPPSPVTAPVIRRCPPTPKRPSSDRDSQIPYLDIDTPFTIRKWDTKEPLTLIPKAKLGSGDYGTAWLVQMPDGTQKVYKVDYERNVRNTLNELYHYAQLRNIGFPVAIHDDLETFIQRPDFQSICQIEDKCIRDIRLKEFVKQHVMHGYHLRQYVERPFPENANEVEYDQVKEMMAIAMLSGIPADLQRSNIGITEDGQVLYFDLNPNDEEGFFLIVRQCLKTFAQEGTPLWNWLDPGAL